LDRKEREFQLEQERAKIMAELKCEKHRQVMEKLDLQARLREQEARAIEGRGKQSDGNGDEVSVGKAVGKVPKMPYFDEVRDFMDSYLGRFKRFAETQKWKREHWAMYLSALRKGRALDVYSRTPPEQASDFERLKRPCGLEALTSLALTTVHNLYNGVFCAEMFSLSYFS